GCSRPRRRPGWRPGGVPSVLPQFAFTEKINSLRAVEPVQSADRSRATHTSPARGYIVCICNQGSREEEMKKEELTAWALKNGWQMIDGHPSLVKPARPKEAIVRLVLKATVVNIEFKKPSGKWEKVSGAGYGDIEPDPETGMPRGLGLVRITGLTMLMQEN